MSKHASFANHWLMRLQKQYRQLVGESPFFAGLADARTIDDFQWIRQLYYLSCDFTAAVALRYGSCRDPRFRDVFGEHAAEEVTHPHDLTVWMREFGFLAADEAPDSVPPSLETLAYGSYFIRSALREPLSHQIITLNLMGEGMACDMFAAINPRLAGVGLTPKGYWKLHEKADMKHQILGLDLISDHEPDSPEGKRNARVAWKSPAWRGRCWTRGAGSRPSGGKNCRFLKSSWLEKPGWAAFSAHCFWLQMTGKR